MTIITKNITADLLISIRKEAKNYLSKYDPNQVNKNILYYINEYLKDTYNIYIKSHTQWGETTYYNTLAFYAKCPHYKLVRRRDFLHTYGKHFNGLVIPIQLHRQLRQEFTDDPHYMARVCFNHTVRHIPKSIGGCESLIFHNEKKYQLFKLKYSEFL